MKAMMTLILGLTVGSCSDSGKSWSQSVVKCHLEVEGENGGTYQVAFYDYTYQCSGSGTSESRHSVTCGFYYTSADLAQHRTSSTTFDGDGKAACKFEDLNSQLDIALQYKNTIRVSINANEAVSEKSGECVVEKSSGEESSICRYPGFSANQFSENIILDRTRSNYVGSCVDALDSSDQSKAPNAISGYYDGVSYTGVESYFGQDVIEQKNVCLSKQGLWKDGNWSIVHTLVRASENCYVIENELNGFLGAYKISWPVGDSALCSLLFDEDKRVYVKP